MAEIPVNASDAVVTVDVVTNGQVVFAYDFRADVVSDLRAVYRYGDTVIELVGGVNFLASGLANPTGGTITFTSFVATLAGATVTIYRNTVIDRLTDLQRDLFAATLNNEFDKVYMILQEQSRDLGRTVRVPVGSSGITIDDDVPTGSVLIKTAEGIGAGPTVDEISSAESYAEAAEAAAAILAEYVDIVAALTARHPQHVRYETDGDDTVLREIVASGGAYRAFPVAARTPGGNICAVYWRGDAHSPNVPGGNQKGQFDVIVSQDGGARWTAPAGIYGNMDHGDPQYAYYAAMGNDRLGRVVLIIGIYDGVSAVRPWITRSNDGLTWSPLSLLTVTGSVDVTAATLVPFGSISLTPSGKMVIPFYQAAFNWAAVIDDDVSETTLDLSSVVINSSSPAYSESAICCVTENEWLCFLRLDGATNSIPIMRTVNGGAIWTSLSDTGMAVGGGYVVQAAFPFELCGVTHIGLLTGARKSVSAPIVGSPGVIFAVASYKDMVDTGTPQFRRRHFWPLVDDGFTRDAYVGYVFDAVSCSLGIVTHEETGEFESRILTGSVNVGATMNGKPERTRKTWTPVLYGATTPGAATYTTQRGSYTEDGDWIEFDFRLDISAFDGTGNLGISGWPEAFALDQELSIQTAFTLTSGTSFATLRPTVETTTAAIMERQGTSFLSGTEVSYPLSIRARGRYMKNYDL